MLAVFVPTFCVVGYILVKSRHAFVPRVLGKCFLFGACITESTRDLGTVVLSTGGGHVGDGSDFVYSSASAPYRDCSLKHLQITSHLTSRSPTVSDFREA
jgi:hypothetical protein